MIPALRFVVPAVAFTPLFACSHESREPRSSTVTTVTAAPAALGNNNAGVSQKDLDACLSAIKAESCGNVLDSIELDGIERVTHLGGAAGWRGPLPREQRSLGGGGGVARAPPTRGRCPAG